MTFSLVILPRCAPSAQPNATLTAGMARGGAGHDRGAPAPARHTKTRLPRYTTRRASDAALTPRSLPGARPHRHTPPTVDPRRPSALVSAFRVSSTTLCSTCGGVIHNESHTHHPAHDNTRHDPSNAARTATCLGASSVVLSSLLSCSLASHHAATQKAHLTSPPLFLASLFLERSSALPFVWEGQRSAHIQVRE